MHVSSYSNSIIFIKKLNLSARVCVSVCMLQLIGTSDRKKWYFWWSLCSFQSMLQRDSPAKLSAMLMSLISIPFFLSLEIIEWLCVVELTDDAKLVSFDSIFGAPGSCWVDGEFGFEHNIMPGWDSRVFILSLVVLWCWCWF